MMCLSNMGQGNRKQGEWKQGEWKQETGERKKVDSILTLQPDILVVQECEQPYKI